MQLIILNCWLKWRIKRSWSRRGIYCLLSSWLIGNWYVGILVVGSWMTNLAFTVVCLVIGMLDSFEERDGNWNHRLACQLANW